MSVIMKPEDLRGPVLLAMACSSEGERDSTFKGAWLWGGEEGAGDMGAFTDIELASVSDMAGLMLDRERGYSEYSLFLGGTGAVMVAVSTVILRSLVTEC